MKFILAFSRTKTPAPGPELMLFPEHMTHADVWEMYRLSSPESAVITAGFWNDGVVSIGSESMGVASTENPSLLSQTRDAIVLLLGENHHRQTGMALHDKAQEIADRVEGSDDVLTDAELRDVKETPGLADALSEITFRCATCGWWYDVDELADGDESGMQQCHACVE